MSKPEAVFPRVDKKEVMERIEAMEQEIRNPEGRPKWQVHRLVYRRVRLAHQRRRQCQRMEGENCD